MTIKLTKKDKGILLTIKELIDKEFKKHISIWDLESKHGMNESKLRNGFRQQYGITIFEYQSLKQLEYVIAELNDPDLSVQEIATRAGYKDISTFNRRFHKQYGMTPSEWKKRQ